MKKAKEKEAEEKKEGEEKKEAEEKEGSADKDNGPAIVKSGDAPKDEDDK